MQSEVEKIGKSNRIISLLGSEFVERRNSDTPPKIPLALIDKKPLTLASFTNFIRGNATEYLIIPFNGHDEFMDYMGMGDNQNVIQIILFNIGSERSEGDCVSIIPSIKTHFPSIPLVLIADCEEPGCYIKAINMGASAYITTSLLPSVVIAVLKLVLEGGVFAPVQELFSGINQYLPMSENNSSEASATSENSNLPDTIYFTPRQLEVLDHVKLGEPNKVIAYKLGMQECTVKVHIRDIMKKLDATNRTQLVYKAAHLQAELENKD